MTAEEAVRRTAWGLCVDGRFSDAKHLLLTLLARQPADVGAQVMLAKVYLQEQDPAQALVHAVQATRLDPQHVEAIYTQGRAHRARGELPAAEACYRRALLLDPDHPDLLTSLGVLLRADGRTDAAIDCYRRALGINPSHAAAAQNLARASLARAAELRRIAETRLAAGRPEEALQVLATALTFAPADADIRLVAGKLDCAIGRPQSGLLHIEEAARLAPHSIEAHEIARRICAAAGLHPQAVHYSACLEALAPSADLAVTTRLLLPSIEQSIGTIRETRERYRRGLEAALAGDAPLVGITHVQGNNPLFIASHTAFYLAYHGENNRELQRLLAQVYLKRIPGLAMTAPHCHRLIRRPGRLRIGFISRFFRNHSIGKTSRGLIEQLSRERFEVYALRITPSGEDAVTSAIRAAAHRTLELNPELARAREEIAALELDVLFYQDIGMEQTSYFLAFARLAPVQCVSFGHPDTTGIPTMDYFVSNDLYEPANAQDHYSERLVTLHDLPTLAYYYRPPTSPHPASRETWGFTAGQHLYVCPQTLFKLHPDIDALFAGILGNDARGVIVLLEGAFAGFGDELRRRFRRTLPGVAERVRFLPGLPHSAFLDLLTVADVMLDTPHFNGMNSSLEAFACGAPVVTWPGALQRGRHTQAMYKKMHILDAIASDAGQYVAIAVRIANDPEFAGSLRRRIAAHSHVLFEDRRVVQEFERFFERAVRERQATHEDATDALGKSPGVDASGVVAQVIEQRPEHSVQPLALRAAEAGASVPDHSAPHEAHTGIE